MRGLPTGARHVSPVGQRDHPDVGFGHAAREVREPAVAGDPRRTDDVARDREGFPNLFRRDIADVEALAFGHEEHVAAVYALCTLHWRGTPALPALLRGVCLHLRAPRALGDGLELGLHGVECVDRGGIELLPAILAE